MVSLMFIRIQQCNTLVFNILFLSSTFVYPIFIHGFILTHMTNHQTADHAELLNCSERLMSQFNGHNLAEIMTIHSALFIGIYIGAWIPFIIHCTTLLCTFIGGWMTFIMKPIYVSVVYTTQNPIPHPFLPITISTEPTVIFIGVLTLDILLSAWLLQHMSLVLECQQIAHTHILAYRLLETGILASSLALFILNIWSLMRSWENHLDTNGYSTVSNDAPPPKYTANESST